MRSLSLQVQPDRSPGINMEEVTRTFELIAKDSYLVQKHSFTSGEDGGLYYNFTFGTLAARGLWGLVWNLAYESGSLGPHMKRASMAMCSSEEGWDQYALLYHYDPAVACDAL
jgi:hypothetical protein